MSYPNVVECLDCHRILVSFNRHDYKVCGCPNDTMVDGGSDYLRYGGNNLNRVQVLKIIKMPNRRKK